jgi:hypothetical protein
MKSIWLLISLWIGICAAVSGSVGKFDFNAIEDDILIRYEKKPPQPVQFDNYHQFERTPFLNSSYEIFLNSNIDESTSVSFNDINELNEKIRPVIKKLVKENFFRIFRLNLFKECPFWKGDGFCMHRSCAVDTIDDWADLPDIWQPEALGKLEDSILVKKLNADAEVNDNEYCDLDGFIHDTVFVDLVANPERFTGYGGDQSWQIWKSIYNENCFNLGHDHCTEKNFFYKIVSGMHASISTHLSNEYLNKSIMDYTPNLEQFMIRVGNHPDRIANLYLNYIVVLKSLIKLETYGVFDNLTFSDDLNFIEKENEFKMSFKELLDPALDFSSDKNQCMFTEDILFKEEDSMIVKEEIRENFKNITRIMDCVHCDRCRLWGKLQTTGYGTALKVLFELKDKQTSRTELSNIELIALVNTFDRLSKSVESINNFKKLFDDAYRKEETGETIQEITETPLGFGVNTFEKVSTKEPKPNDNCEKCGKNCGCKKSEGCKCKDKKNDSENKYKTPDLFKKEAEMYDDVIFPNLENSTGQGLKDIFIIELKNVFSTLKWVIRSYYIFPKIVYNWCLIRIVYYWNTFVGHVDEDFDFNRLYRIEI